MPFGCVHCVSSQLMRTQRVAARFSVPCTHGPRSPSLPYWAQHLWSQSPGHLRLTAPLPHGAAHRSSAAPSGSAGGSPRRRRRHCRGLSSAPSSVVLIIMHLKMSSSLIFFHLHYHTFTIQLLRRLYISWLIGHNSTGGRVTDYMQRGGAAARPSPTQTMKP